MANEKKLVQEIKQIDRINRNLNRKRKDESDRKYVFRIAGYRCSYCRRKKNEKELAVVRKNPENKTARLIKVGICACKGCASEKGSMKDWEFRRYLIEKKKQVRCELKENYFETRDRVFQNYLYSCIYCDYEFSGSSAPWGRKLTIDHKIPVSRGGTNDLKNLCCSCEEHNFEKADRTAEEYFLF